MRLNVLALMKRLCLFFLGEDHIGGLSNRVHSLSEKIANLVIAQPYFNLKLG